VLWPLGLSLHALVFVLQYVLCRGARAFTCALHACMRACAQGDFEALVRGRLGALGVRAAVVEGILAMCRADPDKRPPPLTRWRPCSLRQAMCPGSRAALRRLLSRRRHSRHRDLQRVRLPASRRLRCA